MAALVFPSAPTIGQRYPANPGASGITQYEWDGSKWNSVLSTVSLGTLNQGAYNNYTWPATPGTGGKQLTSDGVGGLTWSSPSVPSMQLLSLNAPFDGILDVFTLLEYGTLTPFVPTPPENLLVILGGVPQVPNIAYTISGSTITFAAPPPSGSTFYAFSNVTI